MAQTAAPRVKRPGFRLPLHLWLLYFLVLVGLAGVLYWFWSHAARNPVAVAPEPKPDTKIEFRFFNAEIHGRRGGTPYWTIYSRAAAMSRDGRYATFGNKPHGTFFNLKDWNPSPPPVLPPLPVGIPPAPPGIAPPLPGVPPVTVPAPPVVGPPVPVPTPSPHHRSVNWWADSAEFDTALENLSLKSHVKIVTDTKDVITTNDLRWESHDERVTTDSRTKIVTASGSPIIQSDKLSGDTKLETLDLQGHVQIDTKIDATQQLR